MLLHDRTSLYYSQLCTRGAAHAYAHAHDGTHTAHSPLWTGQTTVNAPSQSIFEYRRPEKRSTKRLPSATAANISMSKKIETKNKNVT